MDSSVSRRKTKSGFCACAITFQLASSLNVCFFTECLFVKYCIWIVSFYWFLSSPVIRFTCRKNLGSSKGRINALLNLVAHKFWSNFCTVRDKDVYNSFLVTLFCLLFLKPHGRNIHEIRQYIDMLRLATGIRHEKRVVRRFRRCANAMQCTYTNLDSIAYCTSRLYGIACCC